LAATLLLLYGCSAAPDIVLRNRNGQIARCPGYLQGIFVPATGYRRCVEDYQWAGYERVPDRRRAMNVRTVAVPIVAALVVLILASSAAAECAWVFWVLDAQENIGWRTAGGFTSQTQCLQTVKENTDARYPRPEYSHVRESGFLFAIFKEQDKTLIRLMQCLPDTVDPRAPKGSGG
jgi:hypothetical protein